MEDNVDSAVCTGGKLMVYGKGPISEKFYGEGLQFNTTDYYVHKKASDFEEDMSKKTKEKDVAVEDPSKVVAGKQDEKMEVGFE